MVALEGIMIHSQDDRVSQNARYHSDEMWDVAVIGAGVVGCAMARRFTLEGARVLVLEKAEDILEGASKGNSAILHTGFDAPKGSFELECIQSGYEEFIALREELGLSVLRTGAHVVAWTEEEEEALGSVVAKARANDVDDVRLVGKSELFEAEPHLARSARAAAFVPKECVVDPWSAPLAYLRQAVENGAEIRFNSELTSGSFDGGWWSLHTTTGDIECRYVINCAGLYGDLLDREILGTSQFEIRPRKGQFVVFDKAASGLLKSIILGLPRQRTKGILLCPTVFGNVLAGPTAEDQMSRDDTSVDRETLQSLIEDAVRMVPALGSMPITATYAGLRPASQYRDFQIVHRPEMNWITAGAIRSTGLTAALGIAQKVYQLYSSDGIQHEPLVAPLTTAVRSLAENGQRDWQYPGHGGIVCHCEMVTEREIRQALEGPLAANSLGGLKRRTRATMGRCQGFYCLARLAELTGGKFRDPIAQGSGRG
jgi:glycerol-3-phosphate dehydrogenase